MIFDHKPIALYLCHSQNFGPLPLLFSPLWLQDPRAMEVIFGVWNNSTFGMPTFIWKQKLKAIKLDLKEWTKFNFKQPYKEKPVFHAQLENLQMQMKIIEITKKRQNKEYILFSKVQKAPRS